MVQHLTREGGFASHSHGDDEEDWNRAHILASTVEEQELVDPMLAPDRLVYRLFHEEKVRAFKTRNLSFECGCSAERVKKMLASFGPDDLADMAEDGQIEVTCEFCNRRYSFDPDDFV